MGGQEAPTVKSCWGLRVKLDRKGNGLVLLLLVRKVAGLDVVDILLDGGGGLFVDVQVAAEEAGFEFGVDAQEVVHDQDLSIAVFTCSDADGRDVQALGNF